MFVLRAFLPNGKALQAERFRFVHLPIRIGRNALNDFSLLHEVISAFHARIEDVEGRVCIRDLGSKNGVYLPARSGQSLIRIEPNTSVDLSASMFWFYLAGQIQVQLEIVQGDAPLRCSPANGVVLGNVSIIGVSPVGPAPPSPMHVARLEPRAASGIAHSMEDRRSFPVPAPAMEAHRVREQVPPAGSAQPGPSPGKPSHASSWPAPDGWSREAQPLGALPALSPTPPRGPLAGFGSAPPPGALPSLSSAPPAGALPSLSSAPPPGALPGLGSVPAPDALPYLGSMPPRGALAPQDELQSGARPIAASSLTDSDEPPETRAFDMEPGPLALQGLRELAGSLVPGHPLNTTGDVARFITKVHDSVDVFCRTFVPLRQGYERFVSSLALHRSADQRTHNRSRSALALENARNPQEVALALLDPHERSFDAPQAVEGILADLMLHQLALLDGVMEGVRALLEELSPASIDAALKERRTASLLTSQYRLRWLEYCSRFEQLSEGQRVFAVVFGHDFAEAYQRYWQNKAGEDRGLHSDPPPR